VGAKRRCPQHTTRGPNAAIASEVLKLARALIPVGESASHSAVAASQTLRVRLHREAPAAGIRPGRWLEAARGGIEPARASCFRLGADSAALADEPSETPEFPMFEIARDRGRDVDVGLNPLDRSAIPSPGSSNPPMGLITSANVARMSAAEIRRKTGARRGARCAHHLPEPPSRSLFAHLRLGSRHALSWCATSDTARFPIRLRPPSRLFPGGRRRWTLVSHRGGETYKKPRMRAWPYRCGRWHHLTPTCVRSYGNPWSILSRRRERMPVGTDALRDGVDVPGRSLAAM